MEKLSTMKSCFEGRLTENGKKAFISAPAKINLFLKVTGVRDDGYHDIYSWFQAIDLADHMEIEQNSGENIEISVNRTDIPTGPDNLVYQAAERIRQICGSPIGFKIKLFKNIPAGAGLGGGSSDAAAFIKAADQLLNLGLTHAKKVKIGLDIGSDIPFFFSTGQAEVTGRGEIVKDLPLPLNYRLGLITPHFEIRASEAYRKLNLDLTDSVPKVSLSYCHQIEGLIGSISSLPNDLEEVLSDSHPILEEIRELLSKTGADIVRLTGSGPTVFALFQRKGLITEQLVKTLEGKLWEVNVANPIILSV